MVNPPVCLLVMWESRNWRKLKKATDLCKDYGLAALSRKLFIGNVKKDEIPKFQQKFNFLFGNRTDKFFLFVLCKSCLEISSLSETVQAGILNPPAYEIV